MYKCVFHFLPFGRISCMTEIGSPFGIQPGVDHVQKAFAIRSLEQSKVLL